MSLRDCTRTCTGARSVALMGMSLHGEEVMSAATGRQEVEIRPFGKEVHRSFCVEQILSSAHHFL